MPAEVGSPPNAAEFTRGLQLHFAELPGVNHAVAGVKANPVADAEFQHLGMRTHLLQRTKPLDDPVIQVDELASLSRSMSIFVICHPRMEEVVIGDKLAGIISPADHR